MKYDKTTIAGVAACVLLLLLWGPLMRSLGLAPSPRQQPAGPAITEPSLPPEPPMPEPAEVHQEPAPAVAEPHRPVMPRVDERLVPGAGPVPEHLETLPLAVHDLLALAIDTRRGGVVRATLQRYETDEGQERVQVGYAGHPFCAFLPGDDGLAFGAAEVVEHSARRLVLQRVAPDSGVTLREEWALAGEDSYQMSYTATVRNPGTEAFELASPAVTVGALPQTTSLLRTPGGRGQAGGAGGAVDVFFAEENRPQTFAQKHLAKMDTRMRDRLTGRDIRWIAVHSQYFLFFLAPRQTPVLGCVLGTIDIGQDGEPPTANDTLLAGTLLLGPVTVPPAGEHTWTFSGYIGPKESNRLHEIGDKLESILRMDWFFGMRPGWMGALSRLILRSLVGLNRFFNHRWGYGFAIMIITFVVKMIFWPLTHRSTVSMRKMQQLQPLIKQIREQHKDQPEKMNRKVMALYREHKVNPLGGCLPILLQMPVFLALFNTFRSAIELRHAGFLWVRDLSLPDTLPGFPPWLPIRPLALFMGGTMYLQQKLTPQTAESSQARMMSFMTIFFMFIFYGMPSGLTLYWTVNQVLTIVQNLVTRRLEKRAD